MKRDIGDNKAFVLVVALYVIAAIALFAIGGGIAIWAP